MKPSSVINAVATGENIRIMLNKNNLTVPYLQDYIFNFGSPQTVYKWLRGASLPTIEHLAILAATLGVSMDEIVIVGVAVLSMLDGKILSSREDIQITLAAMIELLRAEKVEITARR